MLGKFLLEVQMKTSLKVMNTALTKLDHSTLLTQRKAISM